MEASDQTNNDHIVILVKNVLIALTFSLKWYLGETHVFSELNYRNVVSMYINWKHTVRHINYITLPRLFAAWMYAVMWSETVNQSM